MNGRLKPAGLVLSFLLATAAMVYASEPQASHEGDVFTLTRSEASHFAGLALKCVSQEYPNKLDHTMVWSKNLQPLADVLVDRYKKFLPRQTYPIRTGVHPNTAFGLAFALDYARAAKELELALIVERSQTYFRADTSYPIAWEPGGEDFLSPGLVEADLMLRVLKPLEFRKWFHRFLPGLAAGKPKTLLAPATVADRSDPKIVHLDGLNLSRTWCMRHIASELPAQDPARRVLARAAAAHAKDALAHVASGDYGGEHWLASFAVYMLTTPSVR